MTFRKQTRGFTLIELMITVAIVAILAGVAGPAYMEYVRRGRTQEATSTLSNARVQFEQYFQDARTYVGGPCPVAPANANFAYGCVTPDANSYTINAVGAGTMAGYTYTINQANVMTSVTPGGGGGNCWATKKGEAC